MKKFLVTQAFDGPAENVAAAYASEATWRGFAGLPFAGTPEVVSFETSGTGAATIEIATRYTVTIELPAMAKTFIDADKLSFVEKTVLAPDGSGSFTIVPDHYGEMLSSSGTIEMVPMVNVSERLIMGMVNVDLGWVGKMFEGPVEDVIVKGLKEALAAQARQVPLG